MAKGYWVGMVEVTDPEGFKQYIAANTAVARKHGGRFLVRGGTAEWVEGTPRNRVIVIEFPDHAAALACYRSPEYAAAKALRQGRASVTLTVVEGYDGPQPADG